MSKAVHPLSLEAAIRRACKPLGGTSNAGLHLGGNRYFVAHAANESRADMLRLDHAIQLDQLCYDACGETPLLAYFQAALAPEDGPKASVLAHVADVSRRSGAVVSALAESLADGELSAAERKEALSHIEGLQARLAGLRETLKEDEA
jgi:hypothetical protein